MVEERRKEEVSNFLLVFGAHGLETAPAGLVGKTSENFV